MTALRRDDLAAESGYVGRNRAAWERWAPYYKEPGRRAWADTELRWGIWGSPESELNLLGKAKAGMNVVELGCGTGAVCAGLARRGLEPVGVDIARSQLASAAALQGEFGVSFRLDQANAEAVPYEAGSFDLAISEYGASLWCDPYSWVPEAARLLRSGGLLIFITASPLLMVCTPDTGGSAQERLERPYFGMHRFEFATDDAVEFHLGHADWVQLLVGSGFDIESLIEVRPDPYAVPRHDFVSNSWARSWPSEDVWTVRRR